MDFKSAVTMMLYITIIVIQGGLAGVLRRTPKVYNALITTDENLTPSRAYPVIQPHIHETAITYPTSYSYSGYSQYQPYESYSTAFNQYSPIQTLHYASRSNIIKTNPFLAISSEQQPYPFNNKNDSENDKQLRTTVDDDDKNVSENVKEKPDQTSTSITNEIQTKQNSNNAENKKEDFESKHPVPISNNNNNNKNEIPSETLPIELNEYGLPPSLIPISSSSSSSITAAGTSLGPTNTFSINNPINLLPFLYNSPYPLIYDQYSSSGGGYQSNPYLPPFGYYPPHIYFNDYAPNQQPSNKHSDNINNEIFSKDNSFTKQVQSEPEQEAGTAVTDDNKVIQKIKINNLNDNDELSSKSSVESDDSKN